MPEKRDNLSRVRVRTAAVHGGLPIPSSTPGCTRPPSSRHVDTAPFDGASRGLRRSSPVVSNQSQGGEMAKLDGPGRGRGAGSGRSGRRIGDAGARVLVAEPGHRPVQRDNRALVAHDSAVSRTAAVAPLRAAAFTPQTARRALRAAKGRRGPQRTARSGLRPLSRKVRGARPTNVGARTVHDDPSFDVMPFIRPLKRHGPQVAAYDAWRSAGCTRPCSGPTTRERSRTSCPRAQGS
jgi:hypothetical protein